MRDVAFGQDGDFSHSSLIARYHGELGNGLGNLLNRIVASIVKKSLDGRVPRIDPNALTDEDREVIAVAERAAATAARHMDGIAPQRALDAIWELVGATNKYVDQTAPWQLAKEGQTERLGQVAYTVLEALRWLSISLWPFMPHKCDALRHQLGLPPLMPTRHLDLWPSVWGGLRAGLETRPGAPLFPRFDADQERAALERLGVVAPEPVATKTKNRTKPSKTMKTSKDDAPKAAPEGDTITIDDVVKVDLRVGLVKEAEAIDKSDRLLRLVVDLGEAEPRQILAGIKEHYTPDQLVGKRVVVVANLKPRKMMGLESHGMVLAASDEGGLCVAGVDAEIAPGSRVK
jgi:methionyl-tRNA synthetase